MAGPKTNWIVGTKASIGVDSNTVIIDKLTESGEVSNLKCYGHLNRQLGFKHDFVVMRYEAISWNKSSHF